MPRPPTRAGEVDFPDLVARIRDAHNLTQEGLAHELGVTFSTVNGWERGRHHPSPLAQKALLGLAEECGVKLIGDPRRHINERSSR